MLSLAMDGIIISRKSNEIGREVFLRIRKGMSERHPLFIMHTAA